MRLCRREVAFVKHMTTLEKTRDLFLDGAAKLAKQRPASANARARPLNLAVDAVSRKWGVSASPEQYAYETPFLNEIPPDVAVSPAAAQAAPAVVVLNRFNTDTDEEIALVKAKAMQEGGAFDVVVSQHWALGGKGGVDAANAVIRAAESGQAAFKYLYPDDMSLKDKIETICKELYGAAGIELLGDVAEKLAKFEALGYRNFPVCMAKTQYSFSHDPNLKGAPTGFTVPIRDVRVSCGAGFVFPLLGDINTMPGLPTRPAYYGIDIDTETGSIVGLS